MDSAARLCTAPTIAKVRAHLFWSKPSGGRLCPVIFSVQGILLLSAVADEQTLVSIAIRIFQRIFKLI